MLRNCGYIMMCGNEQACANREHNNGHWKWSYPFPDVAADFFYFDVSERHCTTGISRDYFRSTDHPRISYNYLDSSKWPLNWPVAMTTCGRPSSWWRRPVLWPPGLIWWHTSPHDTIQYHTIPNAYWTAINQTYCQHSVQIVHGASGLHQSSEWKALSKARKLV